MGADAGFDMVPRLSTGAADRRTWDQFIFSVREFYKDDNKVETTANYIVFKAGEHPKLPFEGHKFLRFSSKITGSIAAETGVGTYIDTVTRIARVHFGSRIQIWDELCDQFGIYGWKEVNNSFKAYEKIEESKVNTDVVPSLREKKPTGSPESSLFEVQDIPGKGRGLVACVNISSGTRILCEKPLVVMRSMPLIELEQNLSMKLKALPKELQRQFLSLHNNYPGQKQPFSHTFKTNALPCGSGSDTGGVYPTICLINHSCIPNCHNNWDSNAKHETIHTIRPIAAGDEITIRYDRGGKRHERQNFLKKSFGFDCECRICSLSPAQRQQSDAHHLQIRSLDEAIGDASAMRARPGESLKNCQLLLRLLEDEYDGCAGILGARLYYDAFQITITHGDQARASVFAERSYKFRVMCEGEESPATQRMRSFALQPTTHYGHGMSSMKWRTRKTAVPKGLAPAEFEKWLFRASNVSAP